MSVSAGWSIVTAYAALIYWIGLAVSVAVATTLIRAHRNSAVKVYLGSRLWLVDVAFAAVLTVGAALIVHRQCPLYELLEHDGTALYGAFLSALAALLGFAIAAIALIANLVSGSIFDALRKSYEYDNFWLAFKWTIRALGLATLLSLLAIFTNKFEATRFATVVVDFFAILAAGFSLVRSGFTLEEVLRRTKDVGKSPEYSMIQYPQVPPDPDG